MLRELLTCTVLLCLPYALYSQALGSSKELMKEIMMRDVKSLDEFGARFNGDESHPDLNSRIANLAALCDVSVDSPEPLQNQMLAFCDSIINNDVRFSLLSPGFCAEAECTVTYKGKSIPLYIILQQQHPDGRDVRWAIKGIRGLLKAKIIETENYLDISPVDHELRFMALTDVINENPRYSFRYRTMDAPVDQLSVFLTLVHEKLMKVESVDNVRFYCGDVPGYLYIIEERGDRTKKSGWTITGIVPASDEDKTLFFTNLTKE